MISCPRSRLVPSVIVVIAIFFSGSVRTWAQPTLPSPQSVTITNFATNIVWKTNWVTNVTLVSEVQTLKRSLSEPVPRWVAWANILTLALAAAVVAGLWLRRKTIRTTLRFAWIQQHIALKVAGLAIILALLLIVFLPQDFKTFWDYFQIITGVATLATALIVWFSEAAEDRDESLEKRLDVIFAFRDKSRELRTVMVCEDIYLAGESDIRQWAIQIGQQMSGGDNTLNFRPDIYQQPGRVDDRGITPHKRYRVLFTLNSLPKWGLRHPVPKPESWDEDVMAMRDWERNPCEVFWTAAGTVEHLARAYSPMRPREPSRVVTISDGEIGLRVVQRPSAEGVENKTS
jgi:hypothetical protein